MDSAELGAVLAEIAADKRRRLDEGGGRPDRALELVREHRLGAVRVPVDLGGGGYDKREFYDLIIALGEADPDVPHILRIHLGFVEEAIRTRGEERSRAWLEQVVAGQALRWRRSELSGQPGVYTFDTLLTRDGDDFRLNGQKFYSTGSLYSDYIRVSANDEAGQQISAVIPADREGVVHVDDWDGIGQRETGSGTTLLENVLVHADELVEFRKLQNVDRPRGAQPQLLLHAIAAGILRSVVNETAELLRTRSRAYAWGNADSAREDPQLLQVVGWLSSVQFVVESAVRAAAEAQERSSAYTFEHGDGVRRARGRGVAGGRRRSRSAWRSSPCGPRVSSTTPAEPRGRARRRTSTGTGGTFARCSPTTRPSTRRARSEISSSTATRCPWSGSSEREGASAARRHRGGCARRDDRARRRRRGTRHGPSPTRTAATPTSGWSSARPALLTTWSSTKTSCAPTAAGSRT